MIQNKTIGLSDLISRIKKDLLAEQNSDDPKLFSIDEITVEVNFVINGDVDSGFNLGVVTLGSLVSEERIQKVTVKLSPLVAKQQLLEALNTDAQNSQKTVKASADSLFRGGNQTQGTR